MPGSMAAPSQLFADHACFQGKAGLQLIQQAGFADAGRAGEDRGPLPQGLPQSLDAFPFGGAGHQLANTGGFVGGHQLPEAVLRGQQRNRDAVLARQIAMYLIRSMTNLSLDDIGREFGNRDHSTVIHSLDKVEEQMKKSPTFAETVKEIKTNINSRR